MTTTAKPTPAQHRFLTTIADDGGVSTRAMTLVGSWRPINISRDNSWVVEEPLPGGHSGQIQHRLLADGYRAIGREVPAPGTPEGDALLTDEEKAAAGWVTDQVEVDRLLDDVLGQQPIPERTVATPDPAPRFYTDSHLPALDPNRNDCNCDQDGCVECFPPAEAASDKRLPSGFNTDPVEDGVDEAGLWTPEPLPATARPTTLTAPRHYATVAHQVALKVVLPVADDVVTQEPDHEELGYNAFVFAARWYAHQSRPAGRWYVMPVGQSLTSANLPFGVGEFTTRAVAEHVAELHNRTFEPPTT